jgi:DNA-binding NarL/FixJ family response regulator
MKQPEVQKFRVLIVEDQEMPRQLFEAIIAGSGRYELVKSIRSADMADLVCGYCRVDLILMDVLTELGASGLNAAGRIKKKFPAIRIIIVTSMPEVSWIQRARDLGVDSFWYKEVNEEPIQSIMDRTMRGEHVYPEEAPLVKLGDALSSDFTDREIEILRELITGDTNQEIADRLPLSLFTVKDYIKKLLLKTGLHSRTELAVKISQTGIVINDRQLREPD